MEKKKIEYLIADTAAFIQNAQLQDVAENIITCSAVINEIKNKRQLQKLAVLPYNIVVKEPFSENVKVIADFSKKTGDYPSLSLTDIKVMALTYQMEKEKVGTDHLRTTPIMQKSVNLIKKPTINNENTDLPGFYVGSKKSKISKNEDLNEKFEEALTLSQNCESEESSYDTCSDGESDDIIDNEKRESDELIDNEKQSDNLTKPSENICCTKTQTKSDNDTNCAEELESDEVSEEGSEVAEESDDEGWITPSNINNVNRNLVAEQHVVVGCMTTDFAMQNVLKQMNLNVCALDGRVIKHLRTFILRCYTCFKTTSIMTKQFCPSCGNNTLKKVSVSLDENGQLEIHINLRRPLTGRGKKFSMPTIKGGKHPNNPIIVEDQRIPQNRQTKLAKSKIDALDHDYIPGFSPFVTRDVYSKSAMLGLKSGQEIKHWMRRNPNESSRRRKKK